MAIKFIDILEPVNPAASAIAKSKQIAGARSVATRADLDTIIPQVLSASYNPANGLHENDAVGQVWYVADENKYYKLTGFSVKNNTSPFTIERTWEIFIDSTITASAINNRIDNRINSVLKSGFETPTIFGYNIESGTAISGNAIYMGGYYENDNNIVVTTGGQFFKFPSNEGGTLATQNYVNNIESNINNSIQDIVDNSIEPIQTEIDNSVVKFKNIIATDVISNEGVSTGTINPIVSGNITPLQTLLSEYSNYDTIKLKSIRHFAESENITSDADIVSVDFSSNATISSTVPTELPAGWTSYADKPAQVGPTTSTGTNGSDNVYKYISSDGGYITSTSNWRCTILEADISSVKTNNSNKYSYIDTSIQTVEFEFTVTNVNSNCQNIFYITTAGVENASPYSLAIGNSYTSNDYIAVGYSNSEIGIHSNPKDYATFQTISPADGNWTVLTEYANSDGDDKESTINVAGTLVYKLTIGKGKLNCTVRNITTNPNQEKIFDEITIPEFKFRHFGFMNDANSGVVRIKNINLKDKQVPLYLHVSYTTQQNSNETYLGHSTNYVTVDKVPSELVWNFDNLSIPTEATTLYTRFAPTVDNVASNNTAAAKLLVYTVPTTSGFGYYKGENPFTKFNNATIASEFEMSIYDSNNIDINQSLFAGPDNRNILLSAEDYVKFDRPIASSSIKSVDGNKIGGNISVPFIDENDTFALVSDIDSVNLQTVLDNQGAEQVVLNTILTIAKTRVEDVHPILMLGDFSARIGSVYYPDPNQPGPITGFINETVRNSDGSFTTTNTVAGSPLTITDGTEPKHAATVGQVNQMISAAISSSGTSNEIRYIFENPEIVPVNEEAIWNTVIKYKNAADITGIDYTNVPVVQVYSKTTGEICYPGVNLVAATENNENYTCVNIILRPVTETIAASQYTAVIMTSAEIA